MHVLLSKKGRHIKLDGNHIHTESAGKTEAISMCTDNKQPLNLVLMLKGSVALVPVNVALSERWLLHKCQIDYNILSSHAQ